MTVSWTCGKDSATSGRDRRIRRIDVGPSRRRGRWAHPALPVAFALLLIAGIWPSRLAAQESEPLDLGDTPADLSDLPADPGEMPVDLGEMPLDQLLQLEVTSAAKHPEPLLDASAAIFVLTRDDILRSGYTTIPDLLRLVPGMQIGQLSASMHAVSARGLASRFSRELLVLIDGRSVYTPAFSGVYWEVQDLPFGDIDRIEVIRGPGATLWGANAVNGVINIITRRAVDTPGGYLQAGAGTRERGLADVRYGGRLGEAVHFRVWGKGFQRTQMETADRRGLSDSWEMTRGGFRMDWDCNPAQTVSIFGAAYGGAQGTRYELPTLVDPFVSEERKTANLSGEYVLARWQKQVSPFEDLSLHSYLDHDVHGDRIFYDERTAFDLDLQHRLLPHRRVEVIWGLGYRRTGITFRGSDHVSTHGGRTRFAENLGSAFVQNEVDLVPDRVSASIGCKLEQKNGHDPEWQPNLRLHWHPGVRQTLWSSVSRAVRTPSLTETETSLWIDTIAPNGAGTRNPLPVKVTFEGNNGMHSERLTAWEAGYRIAPSSGLVIDLALFDMRYDHLRGASPGAPLLVIDQGAFIHQPLMFDNSRSGWSRGAELAADWYVSPRLRLRAAYSYEDLGLEQPAAVAGETSFLEFSAPGNLVVARASVDLAREWKLDLIGRYVDVEPRSAVPSYVVMDGSLAWRVLTELELRLTAMNLGEGSGHRESQYELDPHAVANVKPGAFAGLAWTF